MYEKIIAWIGVGLLAASPTGVVVITRKFAEPVLAIVMNSTNAFMVHSSTHGPAMLSFPPAVAASTHG